MDLLVGALDQHREFIAADPSHHVSRPHAGGQSVSDGDQDAVSGGMAETVVDEFEIVEVQRHDGHRPAILDAQRQRLGQPVAEQCPVGQPGQGIPQRLLGGRGQ